MWDDRLGSIKAVQHQLEVEKEIAGVYIQPHTSITKHKRTQ